MQHELLISTILWAIAFQTGKQQLYIYEPESFVPLALVKSEGELSHVSELDEALKDYPLEWQQLQHEHPEQWAEVLAKQNKYRRQAGVAELTAKPKTPTNQRIYYYHVDHLGTPQELTDQTGNIVWSAQYKAWGKVHTIEQPQICIQEQHGSALTERWIEPESIEQPLRFLGQYYDQETGLHYNRFRYYDPDTGRFISQDPIGLMGGFNLYQYAPNPVGWVDPLGLCPDKLGRNMGARVGDDMANHHLIPEELLKDKRYAGLFENAKKSGLDGDAASNGIFLPDNKDLAKTLDLPGHWSNHRKYTDSISGDLDVLNEQFRHGKLSDMDVVLGLGDIQRRARSGLEGGVFSTGKNWRLN